MRSPAFISLYIAVFVAVMGISMVSPLLPVYARDLGASGVWLGLTFSSFAIVQVIFGPFAGRLSDRFGRKQFIIAGLLVYVIAALGYLTAQNFYQVIGFRAFSGIGTSLIFSVSRAYIGDMTPRGQEGRWHGTFATADILGFGTGPLLAGVMREAFGFEAVFVAMATLLAAAAFIVLWWLPRIPPAVRGAPDILERVPSMGFARALALPVVAAVTLYMVVSSLSFGASLSFLAIRLEDDLGSGPILIGVAFAMQDFTSGFAQPVFGRLADRFDRRRLVAIGLVWNAIFIAMLAAANSYLLVVAALMLMGASNALAQVAASAIQVVAGRRAGMGTVLGLGSAGNGLGIVLGSVVGGLLLDAFDIGAPFYFGAVAIALGAVVFLWLTRNEPTEEPLALRGAIDPPKLELPGSDFALFDWLGYHEPL